MLGYFMWLPFFGNTTLVEQLVERLRRFFCGFLFEFYTPLVGGCIPGNILWLKWYYLHTQPQDTGNKFSCPIRQILECCI
jgi:hypothetical protein